MRSARSVQHAMHASAAVVRFWRLSVDLEGSVLAVPAIATQETSQPRRASSKTEPPAAAGPSAITTNASKTARAFMPSRNNPANKSKGKGKGKVGEKQQKSLSNFFQVPPKKKVSRGRFLCHRCGIRDESPLQTSVAKTEAVAVAPDQESEDDSDGEFERGRARQKHRHICDDSSDDDSDDAEEREQKIVRERELAEAQERQERKPSVNNDDDDDDDDDDDGGGGASTNCQTEPGSKVEERGDVVNQGVEGAGAAAEAARDQATEPTEPADMQPTKKRVKKTRTFMNEKGFFETEEYWEDADETATDKAAKVDPPAKKKCLPTVNPSKQRKRKAAGTRDIMSFFK